MRARGNITQRGTGSWRISASVQNPLTGGRERVRRTIRGSRKDAQQVLTKLTAELDAGLILGDASRMTLTRFMEQWLEHIQHRVRPTTFDRYEGVTRLHIVPALGKTQLSKLRPLNIQAFEARLLRSGRAKGTGGLSAQTVVHVHRVLSAALSQAVRWQLLAVNPAIAVQPPRAKRPALTIPDARMIERIIVTSEGTLMHIAVLLAAATGMRRGEVLGLRWSSVDLEQGLVRVVSTYQRSKKGCEFADPKTDRARRTIALPEFAIDALRQHRLCQTPRRLRAGTAWRDNDLVVELGDGRPIDPGEFSRKFGSLVREARADGVRFHDLRHAFATMLLTSGIHPKIASEALGHSTVGITLDTYSHVLPNMQAQAAAAIQEALGGISRAEPTPDPPNVHRLRPKVQP